MELLAVRLHDRTGDDLDSPSFRRMGARAGRPPRERGGRLVRVVEFVPCTSPPSRIAALVKVELAFLERA
jgi:hypothetical protein